MMNGYVSRWVILLVALSVAFSSLFIQAVNGGQDAVVLDASSFWRMHFTLKPPVVEVNGQLDPYLKQVSWLDGATAEPAADWMMPAFDASNWLRTTGRGGGQTPYLARQCMRGTFKVTDLRQVRGLKLSIDYHGGVIVYLNGRELLRQHLPVQMDKAGLAEAYPLEAYVAENGDLLATAGTYIARGRHAGKPDAESQKRIDLRRRSLRGYEIPSSALKPGVNVLAIEIVRSPYHKVMLETESQAGGKNRYSRFDWYTCELLDVTLTALSEKGLQVNSRRPEGLQVWVANPLAGDSPLDYGDPNEPLGSLHLAGARNGVFSGKVMIGSSDQISGIEVDVDSLNFGRERIDAANIQVRYGQLWGGEAGYTQNVRSIRRPYAKSPGFFGAVVNSPPHDSQVVPVWVTVRTPADIAAGQYTGALTIKVEGQKPVRVPMVMEVMDYTLPDSQNYRTWVEMIQSPDTLAVEYDLPLWSTRHLEMIGQSFALIRDTGTRVVHIPVIAHTNLGNGQSMIRWIKKGENQYAWDFTVMEQYLDLVEANLGRPKVVVLQVWEIYMSSTKSAGKRFGRDLDQRLEATGGQPLVTMIDPATGKTENVAIAGLDDPASQATWQALISEVRSRLRRRGMEDALMLGMFTDAVPPVEHFEFFHHIAPDLKWVHQGHGRWQKKVYGIAEVGYQTTVWGGFRFGDGFKQTNQKATPVVASLQGWRGEQLDAVFERNTGLDLYPTTRWRYYAETGITSELRGVGRIGADYWKVVKNRKGRRVGWAHERFTEGGWGGKSINLNLCSSALAPGVNGPAATTRLLAFIEGVQECEARIMLEQALGDEAINVKMGRQWVDECQEVLDERLNNMWRTLSNYQLGGPFFFKAGAWRWAPGVPGHRWRLASDWQSESRRLYELAGHVQRTMSQE